MPVAVVARPASNELLDEFLAVARQNATHHYLLAAWLRDHEQIQDTLAAGLSPRLDTASWMLPATARSPVTLAVLTITTLRETCDALWCPSDLARPECLLRRRFERPPGSADLARWAATRLRWFAGWTVATVATHLALPPEAVLHRLAEAGPDLDREWRRRFIRSA